METGLAGCPRRIRTRRCRIRTQSPTQKPGNRVEKSGNGPRLVGFTPQADIGALRPDVRNVPATDGKFARQSSLCVHAAVT
jgi:hypothetical protein